MLLELQKYLQNKTLEDLTSELAIKVYKHPDLPLVGFKYNQIDSPTYHTIVQECRGIVLEDKTWNIVAKPFGRFFNVDQIKDQFDFTRFSTIEKLDGSLIILYFYNGEWLVNISGSFALDRISVLDDVSFGSLFWNTLPDLPKEHLNKKYTYLFELCTSKNKIVRSYEYDDAYLIGAMNLSEPHKIVDCSEYELDCIAANLDVPRPQRFDFRTMNEVREGLSKIAETDATFEGFVLRDVNNLRKKIKSSTYLTLHKHAGNGKVNKESIIKWILEGDTEEFLTYFPELQAKVESYTAQLNGDYRALEGLLIETMGIETQKELAMRIKDEPYSGLLFKLRKSGMYTIEALKEEWKSASKHMIERVKD